MSLSSTKFNCNDQRLSGISISACMLLLQFHLICSGDPVARKVAEKWLSNSDVSFNIVTCFVILGFLVPTLSEWRTLRTLVVAVALAF